MTFPGDCEIADYVTIDAGTTITRNYAGVVNQRTTIENNTFIESGTNLIAAVRIGADASAGSGSALRNIPRWTG